MDQILQIGLIILAVILAFVIIRFILSVAARVLTIGCGLLVLIAVGWVVLTYFGFIG